MRTIAIGDIHGCSKAIRSLIATIDPRPEDVLVFLGDYVDRGPDSRGTVDFLVELERTHQTAFLRGNHEIMFDGCAFQSIDPKAWFQMGGLTTLVSYGGHLDAVPADHKSFIQRCMPWYENERHLFVHANYLAELPMDQQPERSLYWEHLSDRVPGPHVSGKTVWLGHSPQIHGNILDLGHVVCIDTFCFGGKYLTAIDVDSRELWQVDPRGELRNHRVGWTKLRNWFRKRPAGKLPPAS